MDPIVVLITLIATFHSESMKDIQFYSHNPQVVFVSDDICNDVLREASDYFYDVEDLYEIQ